MIKEKDFLVLSCLRNYGRETLTKLSKHTKVPISTLYDRLQWYKKGLISKFTVLLDFSSLGFLTQAYIAVKVKPEQKQALHKFLMMHHNVNSLYRINNGHDYLFQCVFKHVRELEDFLELLEQKRKIKSKHVWYVIDALKQEEFLGDMRFVEMLKAETSAIGP